MKLEVRKARAAAVAANLAAQAAVAARELLEEEEPAFLRPISMHFGVRLSVGSGIAVDPGARVALFGVLLIQQPEIAAFELHALFVQIAVEPDGGLAVIFGDGGRGDEIPAVQAMTLASMAEKSATMNLRPLCGTNAVRISSESTSGTES